MENTYEILYHCETNSSLTEEPITVRSEILKIKSETITIACKNNDDTYAAFLLGDAIITNKVISIITTTSIIVNAIDMN